MKTTWQPVSPETAKAHPLYGIKGWLLFYTIAIILSIASWFAVAILVFALSDSTISISAIPISIFMVISVLGIIGGVQCYLIFSKHSKFRSITSVYWLIICIASILGVLTSFSIELIFKQIPLIMWATIWIIYFQKSRRVRVTFENCIKDDEVQNRQTAVPVQIIPAQPILPSPTVSTNVRPDVVTKTVITPPSPHLQNSSADSDDYLWEQALTEYDSNTRKQGLYARLFSESEGNETLVKANYLRIRVGEMQQLIALEKERIDTEHKIKIAHEIAISETKLQEQRAYDALPKELQEQRAYDALPKGVCPNCKKTLLLLSADKCPKCSALFGPHSAFKISEISKQEQLNVLRLLTQNGNSLTEYETDLLNRGSNQHQGLSKRLSAQTNIINS